ncbi:MAG: hypothetical protein IJ751_09260, partial [Oscillospiraceae bacterium]|nr:hypothetical protein [Oscillospiraceae bacterium]
MITLACVVVFVTTYALILPATTIDEETALAEPGIVLGSETAVAESDVDALASGEPEAEPAQLAEEPAPDAEPEPVTVTYPAVQFDNAGDRSAPVQVHVDAPEGAFPEGTTMIVQPVEDRAVRALVEDAVEGDIVRFQAIDITFLDADGNEIEPQPQREISVIFGAQIIREAEESVIVHVDDQGRAEIVEQLDEQQLKQLDQPVAADEIV